MVASRVAADGVGRWRCMPQAGVTEPFLMTVGGAHATGEWETGAGPL